MPNFPAVKLTDQVLGLDVQAVPLLADEILTVTSILVRANISQAGAREFAAAQSVASATDRMRLAQLLAKLAR